jgi:hypothetical protein
MLMGVVSSAADARVMLEALETGTAGVLLRTQDPVQVSDCSGSRVSGVSHIFTMLETAGCRFAGILRCERAWCGATCISVCIYVVLSAFQHDVADDGCGLCSISNDCTCGGDVCAATPEPRGAYRREQLANFCL